MSRRGSHGEITPVGAESVDGGQEYCWNFRVFIEKKRSRQAGGRLAIATVSG